MTITTEQVRDFVLGDLGDAFAEHGIDPATVGDDFDLLTSGVIDSFGILELIASVNEHLGIEIDFEELDPEGLTVLGEFSSYVAQAAATPA